MTYDVNTSQISSIYFYLTAYKLAHLPEDRKKLLEHEPSMWNAGWSHGKEKLGDIPDVSKGSFYANPLYPYFSLPTFLSSFSFLFFFILFLIYAMYDDAVTEADRTKYPFFYPKNIWPSEVFFSPFLSSLRLL